MKRSLSRERMDDPAIPADELARALRYLRGVNRWFGGRSAVIGCLERWSARWRKDEPVTLIDLGTGSADLPVETRRWALSRGLDLRITAIDTHEKTIALAQQHLEQIRAREPAVVEGISLERVDARRAIDRFGRGSFDYALAALFLHHLPDVEALTVLRVMDVLARRGIIWSDLHRSRAQRAIVSLAAAGSGPIVRHDARVSVEAGFTKAEALNMLRRVDIDYATYRRPPAWYRFTISGEKRGC